MLKFFQPPKLLPNEAERQKALDATGALKRRGDPGFDSLVREVADALRAPIAAISLIDRDRQFFVAEVGLGISETSRDLSFCAHAIHSDDAFIVPDASVDPRFADNTLVTSDPNIRFYAGKPIVTSDGQRLGTVCIIDTSPRQAISDQDIAVLEKFARHAIRIIERRG